MAIFAGLGEGPPKYIKPQTSATHSTVIRMLIYLNAHGYDCRWLSQDKKYRFYHVSGVCKKGDFAIYLVKMSTHCLLGAFRWVVKNTLLLHKLQGFYVCMR